MPASSTAPIVVVGGGLAAARAVEAVRERDATVDVVVVTAEGHRPYERPPLSKDYLRGQAEPDVVYPLKAGWYDDHAIDLRTLTTVVDLAPADHEVTFADGSTLGYSRLLLATGSTPRALDIPGRSLIGVHTLRTVDDADLLAGWLLPASLEGEGKIVVVGDGWIGTEVAASARMLGLDVCLVGQTEHPLQATLGPELGALYGRLHHERGVARHRGDVVRFSGEGGRVTGVDLADGTHLEADLVVVGVGVAPNVGIASAAGIELRSRELGGGIAVDGALRTSATDVFAAGDIASVPSPQYGRPLRVEHWAVAQDTGAHAGRSMLGDDATYDVLPYFFSDQYDVGMEYKGFVDPRAGDTEVVVSGQIDDRELVAFWVREGEVQAGMAVNVWDRMDDVEALIRSRRQVPRAELESFTG
ncbi:NAD(P)/FAD-dependent oxidoreductase [Isoptericola sp. 4D.3]|uniref:NAD(P)/FAD-dependent oxidoreductase n=1 Tax=Isoptericola peretonis TaxID=2918523 RepID=A0ABT0J6X7_9MICO|nr:NAD(P)/FAD-dependent oxidoreductase [Isoptericola sp. 4D.3]